MARFEEIVRRIVREEVRAALDGALKDGLLTNREPSPESPRELSERERAPWMIRPLTYLDWWFTLPSEGRPPMPKGPKRLGTAEAAEALGVTRGTLYDWRSAGIGPPSEKYGRLVKYRVEDLDQWIAEHKTPR